MNAIIYFRPKIDKKMNRDGLSLRQSCVATLEISYPPGLSSLYSASVQSVRSVGAGLLRSFQGSRPSPHHEIG